MECCDWTALKTEYASTDITYRQLAEKYQISVSSVARHGRQEDWPALREQFKHKVITKTVNKAANRAADKLSTLIEATTKAAEKTLGILSDEKQLYRHLVVTEEKNGQTASSRVVEKVFKKADTKALRDLTASLKDLTGLMRDFYDLPTAGEKQARRLANERLKLDKAKAEAANPVDAEGYGVVFLPPVGELPPHPPEPEEGEKSEET